MSAVEELLAHSIRLRRALPGRVEQVLCPKCEGGRRRELSLNVKIDEDGNGATWNCKRGTCGWKGSISPDRQQPAAQRVHHAPTQHRKPEPQTQHRPEWLYEFFAERKIGAKTVDSFGIYATERRFGPPIGVSQSIVFPYVFKGEVVNRKYRPHPAKNPQLQETNALPTLYNADCLADASILIWVEGEPDVLAMAECGFSNAVSLKDGAPAVANFREDDLRFTALATHADALRKVKLHILAGDADGPGENLLKELARRLGTHKVSPVIWPEGCKDACDTLRAHGPEMVQACIGEAQNQPIKGVKMLDDPELDDLWDRPESPTMTTGCQATDKMLKLPAEGKLIVVTGYPSAGKTSWIRFVMVHTMRKHDRKWLVYSPEHLPWSEYSAEVAQPLVGKPFRGLNRMTKGDWLEAREWLRSRLFIMTVDENEGERATLDWIIETAEAAVMRYGITDLEIDPWNEVEHERGNLSETDYTGLCLSKLKRFGQRHGVNIWIIAHPAKPLAQAGTEPPGGYSISGSQHWYGKTDMGLTIWQPMFREHEPRTHNAELHMWKSRHGSRWGQAKMNKGCMDYMIECGRFLDPIREVGGIIA